MMDSINQKIILSKKLENIYRENNIQSLCAPLFSQIKLINYFSYNHFYDDGKIITICSNPGFLKHYYEGGLYVTANEIEELRKTHGLKKRLYGFITKEIALTDILKTKNKNRLNIILGEQFNIEKRLYIIRRKKDYTVLVSIGTNQIEKTQKFIQFCLERLHVLNSFIDCFKEEGRKIVCALKKEMIVSPYKLEGKQENKKLQHYDFKTGNNFSLSPREYECLESMALGRSMKETAHLLNLSPRTIERHINNIKLKTGFYTRSQLVSFCQSFI